MALKGLIDKLKGVPARGSWQPSTGPYPRLTTLQDADLAFLKDTGGLFALWHRGIRPQWIYIGHSSDLMAALSMAREDPDVRAYDLNDGVYVAWTECLPNMRSAAVLHLRTLCVPAIKTSPLDELGVVEPETKPIEYAPPVD